MNDATTEDALASDYQRALAICQAEGRVSASLLQRRLGIGYISALHLASKLNETENGSATDVHIALDSKTLHLLIAMCAAPCGDGDIRVEEEDFQALLTADGGSTTVAIRSAVGRAGGPHRASLAVRNAVATSKEFAQAIHEAKKIIVLVVAARATLMGRELKNISRELRRCVDESCPISLGVHYLERSDDDFLFVTIIFSS
jgi:cell division GTPase FtsZ